MVEQYLCRAAFVNNPSCDAVRDRFGHGIGIDHLTKHVDRSINRRSRKTDIGRIRQRIVQVLGKSVITLDTLVRLPDLQRKIGLRTVCLIRNADDVGPLRQQARILRKFVNGGEEHSSACPAGQMFAQLLPALHLHHALISDKPLGRAEQFGQLVVQIRAVRYQYDCRAGKLPAPHQHPRQEQHRDTLSAPRRAEIGATFAIPVRAKFGVQTDILEQLVRGEELRITTNDLPFILRRIRERQSLSARSTDALAGTAPASSSSAS